MQHISNDPIINKLRITTFTQNTMPLCEINQSTFFSSKFEVNFIKQINKLCLVNRLLPHFPTKDLFLFGKFKQFILFYFYQIYVPMDPLKDVKKVYML
jgi:hypothetical protein